MFLEAVFTVFETALLGMTTFFTISFIAICAMIRVFLLFNSSAHFKCVYLDVIWFCKMILSKKTRRHPPIFIFLPPEHTVFHFQNIEDDAA